MKIVKSLRDGFREAFLVIVYDIYAAHVVTLS